MVMEFPTTSDLEDPGPLGPPGGQKQPVKSHLLASRELLVASLYNLAPLLDRTLASGLLSQENYFEVGAERTPQGRARRLLEVVQAEMDEAGARGFMECLRRCKQHYPRLRAWLRTDADIQRGPTERQLQAQLSVLCGRLGFSVLPVSLELFSNGTLTQFELDQVQAAPTSYQQTHQLLSICLSKGERACCSFYQALGSEDPQLASDISVEDPGVCSTPVEVKDDGLCSTHTAVETRQTDGEGLSLPDTHILSDVLQQVLSLLSVAPGEGARLNVCELGVAVGLPRRTVRECLLEEVEVGDIVQLRALVTLFLSKTQDASRLLNRVAECTAHRVLLSERGCMLLKLLPVAEAFLRTGEHHHLQAWDHLCTGDHHHLQARDHLRTGDHHYLQARDHLRTGDHIDKVWNIFSLVLWDIMAEALEDPGAAVESLWEPRDAVRLLRDSERVETELLQELEECWADGGTESLLQSVTVLAQLLRDLHPLQDSLCFSPPDKGAVYPCRSRRLHRVTRFQGLPARVIRKALGHGAPSTHPTPAGLPIQYRDLCLCITRLLDRVHPQESTTSIDLSQAPIATITQHICSTLARPVFGPQSFDAGVRHRVLSVVKYGPVRWGLLNLQELHKDTLLGLERYLKPGEHHSFQLVPEKVRIFGGPEIRWGERVRGPVAIDNGIEEVLQFVTSEPASFLISVSCRGYDRGQYFEVREPQCVRVSGLQEEGVGEVQGLGGTVLVLAVEGETVWMREERQGRESGTELEQVSQRHSATLQDGGCCFRVTTPGTRCQVKFIYKTGRISAVAERDCEVF
ncbi:uncharacterized protein isoform X1 [Salmo salar]|uniref:Uncharacterized protein isoform X1 n=2 Tax=Salmo salar TaxID=8030 RepID=A0A1S3NHT7_SALSA|nr:uncharacterized protein LOC106579518 isoform X1 [Salmo salar]|eukprot:XP_014014962.1 PREDICTED: uncharacterized protein LOC106579518 isoform X1 [Salmo salar]